MSFPSHTLSLTANSCMPALPVDELVTRIHASGLSLALALTGGGSRAASYLLTTPGASKSVLEVQIPYSEEALTRYLGGEPDQFCSERTARAMAMQAFYRGREMARSRADVVGIGCTASLVSSKPKRGGHRIHIAVQSSGLTRTISIELQKGSRTRAAEEEFAARMILNVIAEVAELEEQVSQELLPQERTRSEEKYAPAEWRDLIAGQRQRVKFGQWDMDALSSHLLFPGAFNPLHEGHRRMAQIASARTGQPVIFEVSVNNVDKPPLDFIEINSRVSGFRPADSCWLTMAPTFAEKAEMFPGSTFIVGADTVARIAEPRYYGDSEEARDAAIATFAANKCRFLVFGRLFQGDFAALGDLSLPPALADLCDEVGGEEFRADVTSCEIRRRAT